MCRFTAESLTCLPGAWPGARATSLCVHAPKGGTSHPPPCAFPPACPAGHYTSINTLVSTFATNPVSFLGMPCNQFGGQEPASADALLAVLKAATGIVPAFDLTQPVSVNGLLQDSTWKVVQAACASPVATFDWSTPSWGPVTPRDVSWNFETVRGVHWVARAYVPELRCTCVCVAALQHS